MGEMKMEDYGSTGNNIRMEQMGCTLEGMEEERMILGRDAQKILKIA